MNDELFERLLREGESSSLDYKRDQYPWPGVSDEDKSELLKDILAFANGWRHADAYILIGVEEAVGRSTVVGVSQHIPDNQLQQFVNSKTNRPVVFSYTPYTFETKQVGIITIPSQERPLYTEKDVGRVKKGTVYYRQGSSTAVASPDDIAKMGLPLELRKILNEQPEEREVVRATPGIDGSTLFVDIYNCGKIPVYLKEVALAGSLTEKSNISFPLIRATALPVADTKGTVEYICTGGSNYDLEQRKEVRYVLVNMPPADIVKAMAEAPPDAAWISVRTYGGEICRLSGPQLQPVLAQLAPLRAAGEEAARPKRFLVTFRTDQPRRELGQIEVVLREGVGPRLTELPPEAKLSPTEVHGMVSSIQKGRAIGKLGDLTWLAREVPCDLAD